MHRMLSFLAVLAVSIGLVGAGSGAAPSSAATPLAFGFNYNPLEADREGTGSRWLSGETVAPLQVAVQPGSIHRFGVQWEEVERIEGEYHFASIDARIGPLADAGLKILPVPFHAPTFRRDRVEDLYCRAIAAVSERGCVTPPADTSAGLDAWEEFIRQLTAHFSSERYAGSLAGVEVWNEPNYTAYWQTPTGPDPVRYARLLCRAHAGVKSVAPAVPVVLGGLVYWDGTTLDLGARYPATPPNMPMPQFLEGVYTASGTDVRQCMDAVAVHNYPYGYAPDGSSNMDPFSESLDMLRAAFQAHGDAGRRIWLTETGYQHNLAGSHEQQAEWGTCAVQVAAAQPDVDVFLWHTLVDIPIPDPHGIMGVYGFDANGDPTPRPVRDWLRDLLQTYGNTVPGVESCDEAWRPPGT